jgi:phage terminase large subunit
MIWNQKLVNIKFVDLFRTYNFENIKFSWRLIQNRQENTLLLGCEQPRNVLFTWRPMTTAKQIHVFLAVHENGQVNSSFT